MSEESNNKINAAPSDIAAGEVSGSRRQSREGQHQGGSLPTVERRSSVVRMVSHTVIEGSARLIDVWLTALIGTMLFHFYVQDPELTVFYYSGIVLASFLTVIAFQLSGLYRLPVLNSIGMQRGRVALAWSGIFATLMLIALLLKVTEDYSRVWFLSWYAIGLIALLAARFALLRRIRRWMQQGRLERRIVIVGGGVRGQQLIEALKASATPDIRICGVFDDRNDDRSPEDVAGYPKLGTVSELVRFARSNRVDLLVMALPLSAEKRVLDMMRKLWVLPVDIRLSAHDAALRMTSGTYSYIGNVPFFNLYDRPLQDWDHVLKAIEDRVLAALFLLALSPLLLLIAIAIKLDSRGPVFSSSAAMDSIMN
jgi:FlaA1/EpsC-like NDP-sugar epimerase